MTEETVQVETPETQESAVPETSETPEPDEQQPPSAESEQDGDGEQGSEEPEWFQKRINQITAKSKAMERKYEQRATAAERELAELKQRLTEKPAQEKPKADDFESHEEYVEALADWKLEQKLSERDKKEAAERQEQASRQHLEQARAEWIQKEEKFSSQKPDYDEVIAGFAQNLPRTEANAQTFQEITQREDGPAILYAVAKDPALAAQVFPNPPSRLDSVINKIKPQPKNLPPPPTGIKTGGGAAKPLAQRSGAEILEHLRGLSQ